MHSRTRRRRGALSIGDDLAVIVGGQLHQTGPAATVAAEPADPDIARLLGWAELGYGTAASGTIQIGQLILRNAAEDVHGLVQAFYRPEDIELRPPRMPSRWQPHRTSRPDCSHPGRSPASP
jgi:ABC-type Fe3+/spermidine/putrescine transport system ATPase subunit